MIATIFCEVDDFCKDFEKEFQNKHVVNKDHKKRNRKPSLITSEILTILIYFHFSKYKTFKDYYEIWIRIYNKNAFGKLVSYNRFLELSHRHLGTLFAFTLFCKSGLVDGISFIDSYPLKVSHNKRIPSHKVFKDCAKRGKTSVGWFFGFKLHVVINGHGEIISFFLTPGNVSDQNEKVMDSLTRKLYGKLFGDKGYISQKLFEKLFKKGITLVTKIKKNMKNKLVEMEDKLILKKRAVIESVGNILKSQCTIEHSRHRSKMGFFLNVIAAIAAYAFRPKKPSIYLKKQTAIDVIA